MRRYISVKNFLDIFNIIFAFIQSFIYLIILKPKVVLSAGSFVSVPVAFSAYFLKIPVLSHQQDLKVGLANRLMSMVSSKVTVTFSKSLADFKAQTVLTGNPVRAEFKNLEKDKAKLYSKYSLDHKLPILLVLGGGTGAKGINDLVFKSYSNFKGKLQIIHILGNRKGEIINDKNYHAFTFLEAQSMAEILYLSDLVVSRCGLSTITELSYLAKPAIFIPMPSSHQEDNALYIDKHQAGLIVEQNKVSHQDFSSQVLSLLEDKKQREVYQDNLYKLVPKEATEKIIKIILNYVRR